jgi:hypothetical protein
LIGIAGTFGVRLADLMTVNHLTVNSLMVPGQRLAIPATTAGWVLDGVGWSGPHGARW